MRFGIRSLLVMLYCCLLTGCGGKETVNSLVEQGNRAMKDAHYSDAIGWYKRAEIIADSQGKRKTSALLWERMAQVHWKAHNYKEARDCFSKAYMKWDHVPDLPVQNKHCCRVLDEWAGVYIEEGNYQEAEPLLEHAWEYSLGKWTRDYADLENVPYRADRLAYISHKLGKNGLHWFPDTVAELERISSGDRDAVLNDVLALEKKRLSERRGTENQSPFDAALPKLYSTTSGSPDRPEAALPATPRTEETGQLDKSKSLQDMLFKNLPD